MIGRTISHYKILSKLGGGGMGVVYEAEDTRLGRPVAIKFLPDELANDRVSLERFEREARAASALNHPHICTVHDVGKHEDQPFLVMELMRGATLNEAVEKKPIDSRQLLAIGVQVADALEAAHAAGIVHRDIKPANLFLTERGEAKILDFGLAKIHGEEGGTRLDASTEAPTMQQLTSRGQTLGTIAYMSPEQARGEELDGRTDLFSLGVVLYELATGRPAFPGETAAVVFDQILNRRPAPPEGLAGELAGLEPILIKALEKHPELRYQSAAELKADLERLQMGETAVLQAATSAATPPAATERPRLGTGRRLALGATVLAVAIAGGLWLAGRTDETAPPSEPPAAARQSAGASIAVLPFADLSPEGDQEYFTDGLSEELINVLAQIRDLKVAGRTSSFQFKDRGEDLRVIGEELNVSTILEGSVRKSGDRVRVWVQLLNAADGFHIWSQTYDRTLDDIFAVQDDIAASVARALELTLLKSYGASEGKAPTADAYNLYLQGHYFYEKGTAESLAGAADYLAQAVELDPGFARGFAELAAVRSRQADNGYLPAAEGYSQARKAVDRALELDPELGVAWAALGWIRNSYDWDWAGADEAYSRAIELDPGNARVVRSAASLAATRGRLDEAFELGKRAAALDPLSVSVYLNRAHHAMRAGRLGEAEDAAQKALELNPDRPWARSLLGRALLVQSRPAEALAEFEQEAHPALRLHGLALAHHALANPTAATAALAELTERFGDDAAFQVAEVHAFRGDTDAAFEWLERAYAQRDGGLADMLRDPFLVGLEDDPRWHPFLAKMGLDD